MEDARTQKWTPPDSDDGHMAEPRYPRSTQLIQIPQRGTASWRYIYSSLCSKSINTALLSDMRPMGAAERLIAAGTQGELVAMLLLQTGLKWDAASSPQVTYCSPERDYLAPDRLPSASKDG
ncbi:hypothetical protein JOB18_026082 [Solea senegalensis]|uniref:Uncharacterized protein n=1 Tax=Solea senegalensis TaxID=28829 RepID=A0AAV6SZM4_SOLSE|nr:hypothetical protein JOB18_026082 [Solea senegalensis]